MIPTELLCWELTISRHMRRQSSERNTNTQCLHLRVVAARWARRCDCRPLRRAALRRLNSTREVPCPHTQCSITPSQTRRGSTLPSRLRTAVRCSCEMPPQEHGVLRVSSRHQLLATGRKRGDTVYFRVETSPCSAPARRDFESLVTSIATS